MFENNKKLLDSIEKFGSIEQIQNIPYGSKVALYGKNTIGRSVYKLIKKHRKDINIAFFIDSFNDKDCFDVKTVLAKNYSDENNDIDIILITHIDKISEISANIALLPQDKVKISLISSLQYSNNFEKEPVEDFYEKISFIESKLSKDSLPGWNALIQSLLTSSLKPLVDGVNSIGSDMSNYLHIKNSLEGATVIDGGVFDGDDSIAYLDTIGKTGKVFAFEPLGDQHFTHSFKQKLQSDTRLKLVEKGLWFETGELHFAVAGTMSHIVQDGKSKNSNSISIPVTSIDDFANDYNIEKIDFIKMDIEGAELNALKGARGVIEKDNPNLAICIYHGYDQYIEIPYYLMKNHPNYDYSIGIHDINGSEIVIYASRK